MGYEKGEFSNPSNNTAFSKVASSVVRLTYISGDALPSYTNGTIFSCLPDDDNGPFVCYILTSAGLFKPRKRHPAKEKGVFPVSKIDVCLPNDQLYKGEVMACDMELNIAVIKIKSDFPLPIATLTPFTDHISVSPIGVSESPFRQHPYPTEVYPGDEVAVVCRAFGESCDAIVNSGFYSVDYLGYGLDRMPFLRIHCQEIINGAPVINCEGDVIGVAFNVGNRAAFLPINIFFKWWKQVLTYGEIRRPWMGAIIVNLFAAGLGYLEDVVHDCDVSDGVFVEGVVYGSPADSANMRSMDVICQCDGRPVRSFLEFTELLWDKSGEVIEAKGVRDGCHFGWKVEIKTIKTGLLPESLAESAVTKDIKTGILPESLTKNVVTRKKLTKRESNKAKDKRKAEKDKEETGSKARTRKREMKNRADTYSDSVSAENLDNLDNLDERRKAKTRKREGQNRADAKYDDDSVATENLDKRKKNRWDLSKCSHT